MKRVYIFLVLLVTLLVVTSMIPEGRSANSTERHELIVQAQPSVVSPIVAPDNYVERMTHKHSDAPPLIARVETSHKDVDVYWTTICPSGFVMTWSTDPGSVCPFCGNTFIYKSTTYRIPQPGGPPILL